LESTGFEFKALGFLHNDVALRLAYSSADVFVAPSIQEAFGKTLVESLACKTPVVCFDATGPASIVEHKVSGYKARPRRHG
jgi:glycosyltransferase involved in cell wall biosynthesis